MKGHTLIEVIIVMLILSVLLTSHTQAKLSVNSACKKLSSFLAYAQNKALITGKNITIEFSNNSAKELNSNNTFLLPKNSSFKEVNFGNIVYGPQASTYQSDSISSPGRATVISINNNSCKIYQSILGARRIENSK